MYEEEKIFGPLTFKQFLVLAGGVGLAYFAYQFLEEPMSIIVSALLIIGSLILVMRFRPHKIDIDNLPNYLEEKRQTVGDVELKKWLQKKVAMITSQIHMIKERGLNVNPEFDKMAQILKQKLDEIDVSSTDS